MHTDTINPAERAGFISFKSSISSVVTYNTAVHSQALYILPFTITGRTSLTTKIAAHSYSCIYTFRLSSTTANLVM